MPKQPYGVRLREARTRRGWTQKVLATRASTSQSRISFYESEVVVPHPTVQLRLADLLEAPDLIEDARMRSFKRQELRARRQRERQRRAS
jgi:transcriptional regulator with XRE-family HTH domain